MKNKLFYFFLIIPTIFCWSQSNTIKNQFDEYEKKCRQNIINKQLDSSKYYFSKLETISLKQGDSSLIHRSAIQKGTLLIGEGKYDQAMDILLKANTFFNRQNDQPNYYYSKYKVGICYYYINRRHEALEIMQDIVAHKQYVEEQVYTNSFSNIGAILIELGMLEKNKNLFIEGQKYLRTSMLLNKKNNANSALALNYSLMAEAHTQLNNKTEALKMLDSAIIFSSKAENLSQKGFALIKKATILNKNQHYPEALININEAVKIYLEGIDIPTKIYAFVEKKKILVNMKKYKEANTISDSIYINSILNYDKRFVDGISKMEVKYKTAEKERKILEQRAELAENGLLLQKRNYQIYGALVIGLLVTLIGYFFFNQQKMKHQQLIKENKLKSAIHKVETQNRLQEQRIRISRDLHDNIGAQLSFIISSIDNLKFASKNSNPELIKKLNFISSFSTTTIRQLRDTIWALNKNEITITDLQSRVLAFIESAKKANSSINIYLKMEAKLSIIFSSIEGMNIFRVIQEAINNALKYANATKIEVNIKQSTDFLLVSIEDNGIGFKIDNVEIGNGLNNMRDRIEEIGGKLRIDSNNEGTNIKVQYRLTKHSEAQ